MGSARTGEVPAPPALQRARRAIVVVDVVESVRLLERHEADVIQRWRRFVDEVRTEVLDKLGGRLVKSLGDGMLLEFGAVRPALAAALEIQQRAASGASALADEDARIHLRIGLHSADVVVDEFDLFGAGVNLAARLCTLGKPGDVVASEAVRDELLDGLDARIEDMGLCWLRHVEHPVQAYRVRTPSAAPGAPAEVAVPGDAPALQLGIGVLPFECVQGTPTEALIGDFIADGVIASLSMTPTLRVPSRLSTRAVAERRLDLAQLGALLGVSYVLSGNYRSHAGRIVIEMALRSVRDGRTVASLRRGAPMQALFEHPSEPIAALAATAHRALLDAEAQQTRSQPLPHIEGYSLLLGSIGLIHRRSPQDFLRAREALEALIDRLPRHGSGYAWLAKWHFLQTIRGQSGSPQSERDKARWLAEQALERDPYSGLAWALRGLLHAWGGHDLPQAEQAYANALSHNPNEALAWLYMATLRSWQGRGEEAAAAAERALALTPLDPMRYYYESLAAAGLLAAGRHEEAIALCTASLRANAAHTPTHRVMAISQVLGGRVGEARLTMQRMRALEPGLTASEFLGRYPGGDSSHARCYAQALRTAGLPA